MRFGPVRVESVYIIVPGFNTEKSKKHTNQGWQPPHAEMDIHANMLAYIMMHILHEEISKLQPVSSLGQ